MLPIYHVTQTGKHPLHWDHIVKFGGWSHMRVVKEWVDYEKMQSASVNVLMKFGRGNIQWVQFLRVASRKFLLLIITVMLRETWQTNRIFSKGMREIKEWEGWTSWEDWRDGIQRTIGGDWSWIRGNSTSFVTGRKEEVGGDRRQFVDMAAYFEFPFLEMDLNLLFLIYICFYIMWKTTGRIGLEEWDATLPLL